MRIPARPQIKRARMSVIAKWKPDEEPAHDEPSTVVWCAALDRYALRFFKIRLPGLHSTAQSVGIGDTP